MWIFYGDFLCIQKIKTSFLKPLGYLILLFSHMENFRPAYPTVHIQIPATTCKYHKCRQTQSITSPCHISQKHYSAYHLYPIIHKIKGSQANSSRASGVAKQLISSLRAAHPCGVFALQEIPAEFLIKSKKQRPTMRCIVGRHLC